MSSQLIEGEGVKRSTTFRVPPEMLTVIGVDTDHRSLAEHPRFDRRVLNVHAGINESDAETLSMKEIGVQQNIKVEVEEIDGKDVYVVVDGRGRTLRARVANQMLAREGLPQKTVPVDAYRKNESSARLGTTMQVILNEHRHEDTPINRAEKMQYLLSTGNDVEDVGKMFRVSSKTVNDHIKLLDMSAAVKKAVEDGKISPTAAVKLHGLSKAEQGDAVEKMMSEGKPTVAKASAAAKATRTNGEEVVVAPSKRQLRRAIENGDGVLSEDFILGLRVALGDIPPSKIKGLVALLRGE